MSFEDCFDPPSFAAPFPIHPWLPLEAIIQHYFVHKVRGPLLLQLGVQIRSVFSHATLLYELDSNRHGNYFEARWSKSGFCDFRDYLRRSVVIVARSRIAGFGEPGFCSCSCFHVTVTITFCFDDFFLVIYESLCSNAYHVSHSRDVRPGDGFLHTACSEAFRRKWDLNRRCCMVVSMIRRWSRFRRLLLRRRWWWGTILYRSIWGWKTFWWWISILPMEKMNLYEDGEFQVEGFCGWGL